MASATAQAHSSAPGARQTRWAGQRRYAGLRAHLGGDCSAQTRLQRVERRAAPHPGPAPPPPAKHSLPEIMLHTHGTAGGRPLGSAAAAPVSAMPSALNADTMGMGRRSGRAARAAALNGDAMGSGGEPGGTCGVTGADAAPLPPMPATAPPFAPLPPPQPVAALPRSLSPAGCAAPAAAAGASCSCAAAALAAPPPGGSARLVGAASGGAAATADRRSKISRADGRALGFWSRHSAINAATSAGASSGTLARKAHRSPSPDTDSDRHLQSGGKARWPPCGSARRVEVAPRMYHPMLAVLVMLLFGRPLARH